MKTLEIPIRELHARTGHFVRLAARHHEIIVTERGRPTARLSPLLPAAETPPMATLAQRRRLRPDYRAVLKAGKLTMPDDSTSALHETSALRDL